MTKNVPIRDAATLIVLRRDGASTPRILMGQRGAAAAFMPNKFVFPGGALDEGDLDIPLAEGLNDTCHDRLTDAADPARAAALPATAIRELWEETGLMLGAAGAWPEPIPWDWRDFGRRGLLPSARGFSFVFRAITPPGRPRRFDARFFMVDAAMIDGDLDDFSAASDELSYLQWVPLDQARGFDLPFITEVVLAEVAGQIETGQPPAQVPFFNNTDEQSLFEHLKGRAVRQAE